MKAIILVNCEDDSLIATDAQFLEAGYMLPHAAIIAKDPDTYL